MPAVVAPTRFEKFLTLSTVVLSIHYFPVDSLLDMNSLFFCIIKFVARRGLVSLVLGEKAEDWIIHASPFVKTYFNSAEYNFAFFKRQLLHVSDHSSTSPIAQAPAKDKSAI